MEAECCVCSTVKYSDRNITPCGSGVSEVNRGYESSCEKNKLPGRKGRTCLCSAPGAGGAALTTAFLNKSFHSI